MVDLSHIAKTIGARIDGDLGYNFLRHFGITINYRDSEICFDDPKRIEDFGNASKAEVPIRLANPAKPLILFDVHANGRGPFQFAVDTGTSTSAITPGLRNNLASLARQLARPQPAAHTIEVAAGALQSFMVGGAEIENMAVVVADFFAMLSHAVGAQLDGIVGYNFCTITKSLSTVRTNWSGYSRPDRDFSRPSILHNKPASDIAQPFALARFGGRCNQEDGKNGCDH